LAVRKKEKGKQETGIVIHSWKQSNQHKPLVKIQSAQVVKIQSAPTTTPFSQPPLLSEGIAKAFIVMHVELQTLPINLINEQFGVSENISWAITCVT